MTDENPQRGEYTRKLKLSGIKYYQKSYRRSSVVVNDVGYTGVASAMAGELIGDIAEAQGGSRKPVAIDFYESSTSPGDLVAVPLRVAGPDSSPDQDPDLGRVIFFKLKGARFEPRLDGKPRKKSETAKV